jgi:hypothetical protein
MPPSGWLLRPGKGKSGRRRGPRKAAPGGLLDAWQSVRKNRISGEVSSGNDGWMFASASSEEQQIPKMYYSVFQKPIFGERNG